jgi:hypothetical protein
MNEVITESIPSDVTVPPPPSSLHSPFVARSRGQWRRRRRQRRRQKRRRWESPRPREARESLGRAGGLQTPVRPRRSADGRPMPPREIAAIRQCAGGLQSRSRASISRAAGAIRSPKSRAIADRAIFRDCCHGAVRRPALSSLKAEGRPRGKRERPDAQSQAPSPIPEPGASTGNSTAIARMPHREAPPGRSTARTRQRFARGARVFQQRMKGLHKSG